MSVAPILEAPNGPHPFDLTHASVGPLLDTEPPPRAWLVHDRLPLGVVGILAAAGGTGKSMATLQLAVTCCTAMPWLGLTAGQTGAVLMLSAEDDREELHRRLRAVVSHYRILAGSRADAIEELVRERLHLIDLVGEDNRLTRAWEGDIAITPMVDRITATAAELPGPVLIVLDPLSRFDGGDGNDNGDGTRLIEAAERIRKATGATVLLPHHVSKAGIRDPESGQEAVRGASGLVDGARWVGLLATLRRDDAKRYDIDPEDAGRYVRFVTPKANYSAPWGGLWLERMGGGVLVPTDLREVKQKSRQQKQEDRYSEILPKLQELVRRKAEEGRPLTRRKVRDYSGASSDIGASEGVVQKVLARAIEDGDIREHTPEGSRYPVLDA